MKFISLKLCFFLSRLQRRSTKYTRVCYCRMVFIYVLRGRNCLEYLCDRMFVMSRHRLEFNIVKEVSWDVIFRYSNTKNGHQYTSMQCHSRSHTVFSPHLHCTHLIRIVFHARILHVFTEWQCTLDIKRAHCIFTFYTMQSHGFALSLSILEFRSWIGFEMKWQTTIIAILLCMLHSVLVVMRSAVYTLYLRVFLGSQSRSTFLLLFFSIGIVWIRMKYSSRFIFLFGFYHGHRFMVSNWLRILRLFQCATIC